MDKHLRSVLIRWQSLEGGDGLQRARWWVRILWFAGSALCFVVVFGVAFGLHPAAVAVAAAVMGWVVAECNALRTRLSLWAHLKRYIDWSRVEEDLARDDNKDEPVREAGNRSPGLR